MLPSLTLHWREYYVPGKHWLAAIVPVSGPSAFAKSLSQVRGFVVLAGAAADDFGPEEPDDDDHHYRL